MRDLDIPCKDIRTREVGMKQIQEAVSPDDVELIRRDYVANGGWETFLSYEDPEKDILIGKILIMRYEGLIVFFIHPQSIDCRFIEVAEGKYSCLPT